MVRAFSLAYTKKKSILYYQKSLYLFYIPLLQHTIYSILYFAFHDFHHIKIIYFFPSPIQRSCGFECTCRRDLLFNKNAASVLYGCKIAFLLTKKLLLSGGANNLLLCLLIVYY